jgi:hypothetical protein
MVRRLFGGSRLLLDALSGHAAAAAALTDYRQCHRPLCADPCGRQQHRGPRSATLASMNRGAGRPHAEAWWCASEQAPRSL